MGEITYTNTKIEQEDIVSTNGISFSQISRQYSYSMPVQHFHDTYEIYYLLEGERYYFIEKETYLVTPGMFVLAGRDQIHKTADTGLSYHKRLLLQIDASYFDTFLVENGLKSVEEIFSASTATILLSPADQQQAVSLLSCIHNEIIQKQNGSVFMIKSCLAQLLILIYRYHSRDSLPVEATTVMTSKHQKVHEVAEYLSAHSETKESLEQIAKRFYISKSYLSRIFREVTGFSVNEYLNLNRIKKAKHLLKDSSYSITEISDFLGFESVTYFERVFKKLTDHAPLSYRKKR